MENVVVHDDEKNQHGFPRGYHFVPKPIELIRLLDDKLAGRPLPYPLHNIFHDVKILDHHPAELYETYKAHEEAGFIYFFSSRKYLNPGGAKTRPIRVTKDGRGWTASGGGKLVTHGGVNGYELTLVFGQKKKKEKKKSDGKNEWGMHEYTKIIAPKIIDRKQKQVEDLALYRLYKVKTKKNAEGQHVPTLSDGSPKSEEQDQAIVGQPHDYDHQQVLAAAPLAPGPSSWMHAGYMGLTGSPPAPLMAPSLQETAVNYWQISPQQQATATPTWPQQQAVNDFELADWDNTLPMVQSLPPQLEPSTVSVNLPTSQQQDAEYPGHAVSNEQLLKMLPPPPLPAPAAEGGYLDDELSVLCDMQQEQPTTSSSWFGPMLDDDDDLPKLTNEEYACTLGELLGPIHDEPAISPRQNPEIEEADPGDHV